MAIAARGGSRVSTRCNISLMIRIASLLVLALAVACNRAPETPAATDATVSTAIPAGAPKPTAGWTVSENIATPESIYYDEGSGFIFTSQINGMPTDRDGNGRIVKLNADGTVAAADWVTGLNAPKGLRADRGTLWTADLDEVIGVEIATGRITSRVKIDGAQFLNDVATSADGTVYVSDFTANKIYAVKDGKVTTFAEGEQLEYPNGLLVEGNRLIVGSWGKPEADFSTKVPGRLFALDLGTKQKTLITPKPFANIDGVESDGRGGYLISDYQKGKILRVSADGVSTEIKQFMPGAADIGFIASINTVLVPHMNENKVAAYDISDALK
jgi:outer membrane protein assembly factor BamB